LRAGEPVLLSRRTGSFAYWRKSTCSLAQIAPGDSRGQPSDRIHLAAQGTALGRD
jgi:hypothetical protein